MNVVVATGGSGGHMFPAIKVARELKSRGHQVLVLGSFRQCPEFLRSDDLDYVEHEARALTDLSAYWVMLTAFFKSIKAIRSFKANVVIGFGGYSSFPGVAAGVFLQRPTLIHEQNVIPGKANQWLKNVVTKVAVSFRESGPYLKGADLTVTGLPCNVNLKLKPSPEIFDKLGLKKDVFTLLITGGSQGSRFINSLMSDCVARLAERHTFQIIHLTGAKDCERIEKHYANLGLKSYVRLFMENIHDAFCISDFVVSRAGAGAVMEIAGYRKPCILIPYPHAGGHQLYNARVLEPSGRARVIEEESASVDQCVNILSSAIRSEQRGLPATDIYKPYAEKIISDEVEKLAA